MADLNPTILSAGRWWFVMEAKTYLYSDYGSDGKVVKKGTRTQVLASSARKRSSGMQHIGVVWTTLKCRLVIALKSRLQPFILQTLFYTCKIKFCLGSCSCSLLLYTPRLHNQMYGLATGDVKIVKALPQHNSVRGKKSIKWGNCQMIFQGLLKPLRHQIGAINTTGNIWVPEQYN